MNIDQKRDQAIGSAVRIALKQIGLETIKNGPFFGIGDNAPVPMKLAA